MNAKTTSLFTAVFLLLSFPAVAAEPAAPASEPAAATPAPAAAAEPAPPPAAEPAPVAAEPTPAPAGEAVTAKEEKLGILVEPRVGGAFPGVLNELGATPSGVLQLGYLFALDQKLGAVIELGYSQPGHTKTLDDPRVPGGSYTFDITQRTLALFVGPKFLFPEPVENLTPFAEAGLKVHFLRTDANGTAGGEPFGEYQETSTQYGGALRGGVGYKLGPGSLDIALEFAYAKIAQQVTGEANIGNLATYLGYMLVF